MPLACYQVFAVVVSSHLAAQKRGAPVRVIGLAHFLKQFVVYLILHLVLRVRARPRQRSAASGWPKRRKAG